MSELLPTTEELKRMALFVPCLTKEGLSRWIKIYLGLDIPDALVDPSSTASPMDVLWETYDAAIKNNRSDFQRVMAYSSRDSFKTLGASVLEVLMVLHARRSVAHMAAIETQASKAQQYVKKFFNRPILRDYVSSRNERKIEVLYYHNEETGEYKSQKEWLALTLAERARFTEVSNYISIIICTIAGANSEHVPFMVVDEVDVVPNPDAYEEAKFIPAPYEGKLPITLLTSTRKYSWALVQKELDNAEKTGLQIRHWNIMDVTERCVPARHKPDEPKVHLYVSENDLKSISEDEYSLLDNQTASKYVKREGYAGCKNCKLFSVCQGRLATKQTSNSPLLKPIVHVIQQFRQSSIEKAKAQLMCWKPSEEGLVYSRFSKEIHMKTPQEIAQMITGDDYPKDFNKLQLINLMKERGMEFVSGMDFGFTHNFAVVTAAIDGRRAFIVDVIAIAELELSQKLELCDQRLRIYNPAIYADIAYPSDIKSFKRAGWTMRDWSKAKDSVTGGIEIVRSKFMPSTGEPELFILQESQSDPDRPEGTQILVDRIMHYHWKLDSAGKVTDIPDDDNDDECDALRYAIMNAFPARGRSSISVPLDESAKKVDANKNWMQNAIQDNLGSTDDNEIASAPYRGRKGRLVWDIG